jgi:hypothetical protein
VNDVRPEFQAYLDASQECYPESPAPSVEAWNAVHAAIGWTPYPPPLELVKAAWLYDRDGHLSSEAQRLCVIHRRPLDPT